MNLPAPIALFTYNRLEHTRKTVEALVKNELAPESELFVFSDGARSGSDRRSVAEVRDFLKGITGFKRLTVTESPVNRGLARSVIEGVTEIAGRFGRIIVLEDDLVTSPHFLKFVNEGLDLYESDPTVASIHGYIYPVRDELAETFFLRGADCWGWATWKRAWDLLERDGRKLLGELRLRRLEEAFDLGGAYPYVKMLEDHIAGRNQSWAILWNASAFLNDMVTLYPGKSLVRNIGLDRSGTHSGYSGKFDAPLAERPVRVERIPVTEDSRAARAVGEFLGKIRPGLVRRSSLRMARLLRR